MAPTISFLGSIIIIMAKVGLVILDLASLLLKNYFMKVMCISEGIKNEVPVWPVVGEIYTFHRVIPEYLLLITPHDKSIVWWELTELLGYCYNSQLFAPLSDIDETELVNEREGVLIH